MLDRKLFRDAPESVRENLRRRRKADRVGDVDRMVALDEEVRAIGTKVDEMRKRLKDESAAVGRLLKSGGDADAAKQAVHRLKEDISAGEKQLESLESER